MQVISPFPTDLGSPFPVTNIPFGVFSTTGKPEKRVSIAIGTYILDLALLEQHDFFSDALKDGYSQAVRPGTHISRASFFGQPSLNAFASVPSSAHTAVRTRIICLLQDSSSSLFTDPNLNNAAFSSQKQATMHLPMRVGDFSDFMCSRTHVDNCSRLAGASTPSNFHAFPTAYNGRASSLIVSGTPILRPHGMLFNSSSQTYEFSPSKRMDYELELGFFVSKPVPFGQRIASADEAKQHIFGFVLLNDWSARDIQFAEMRPLGPFNGKGCATTISPWVVTLDALEEAEVEIADQEAMGSMAGRPPHLRHESKKQTWSIEVGVQVRRNGWKEPLTTVARSDLKALHWTPAQMLSHHASSGCGLRTGDLLGTGTISSPGEDEGDTVSSLGCLRELNMGGTKPFLLENGEGITWIEDGDEVILSGRIAGQSGSVIGFGDCTGVLESATTK